MDERHRALTPAIAATYKEAAEVCLSRHHAPPVEVTLSDNDMNTPGEVDWSPPDARTLGAWANATDATEAGAYGCVIAGVEQVRAVFAVRRAETGTGADYYLGPAGAGESDFEDCFRLEVSGVDAGSSRDVATRLIQKIRQAREGKSSLPALAYNTADIARIKERLTYYLNVRDIVRRASGESLDLKAYEADMRHLIDTYIEADEPRKISPFDNMSLVDLIVKTGIANAIANQLGGLKGNKDAIAETIENNVRRTIVKEQLTDPAYFAKMSALLDEIIAARKAKAIAYEEYLKRIGEVARRVEAGHDDDVSEKLNTPGKRALFNNLGRNEELALTIDDAIKKVRPDGWRGHQGKENVIKAALFPLLGNNKDEVEQIS